jgi:hypothetical protein
MAATHTAAAAKRKRSFMDVSSSTILPDASFFEGGQHATDLMYVRRKAKEQAAAAAAHVRSVSV